MVLQETLKKNINVWISCALPLLAFFAVTSSTGCGGENATAAKEESRPPADVKPADLPPLQVKHLPSGDEAISLPSDLYFAFDSAAFSQGVHSQLQDEVLPLVLDFLADASGHVSLRGYTDGSGGSAYNLWLSRERAETVRRALIAGGAPSARLSARGFGERLANSSARDQSLRRVDVVFQKGGSR